MKQSYNLLSVYEFGEALLRTGDLDPVYGPVAAATEDGAQMARWLLSYWCFYSTGAACWFSEREDPEEYWAAMELAAHNDTSLTPLGTRWPRGAERRHFRGAQAIRAVNELRERYPYGAEDFLDRITADYEGDPLPFESVYHRVKEHRGFGPWIGFKVTDMVERVLRIPVDFTEGAVFMFKDPVAGARRVFEHEWGRTTLIDINEITHLVAQDLLTYYADWSAPPWHDRPVNIQEVETILCKWKSHLNGHYPLGKDTREIKHALRQWTPVSETARRFEALMPASEDPQQLEAICAT